MMSESGSKGTSARAAKSGETARALLRRTRQITRRKFPAEEKIRILLEGIRAELCRDRDIAPSVIRNWARRPMISVIPRSSDRSAQAGWRAVPARKAAAAALPWVAACALMVVVAGCATPRGSVPAPPPEPMEDGVQTGQASWYGEPHHGGHTASGEIYDMHQLTAAHPTLPFGTRVLVTNLKNERSVEVRINDRGPTVAGRIIDLSYAAAQKLGALSGGPVRVRLRVISTPLR
jgi:rare lipoprotein A